MLKFIKWLVIVFVIAAVTILGLALVVAISGSSPDTEPEPEPAIEETVIELEPVSASGACLAGFDAASLAVGQGRSQGLSADLSGAFTFCKNLDEFEAASAEWPDVLGNIEPREYATATCVAADLDGTDLRHSKLCRDILSKR